MTTYLKNYMIICIGIHSVDMHFTLLLNIDIFWVVETTGVVNYNKCN